MFDYPLQHLEILPKFVKSHTWMEFFYDISKSIQYLFVSNNVSEN